MQQLNAGTYDLNGRNYASLIILFIKYQVILYRSSIWLIVLRLITYSLEPVQTLSECKDTITSIDVSDHEILVGSADGKIRRYDLRYEKPRFC